MRDPSFSKLTPLLAPHPLPRSHLTNVPDRPRWVESPFQGHKFLRTAPPFHPPAKWPSPLSPSPSPANRPPPPPRFHPPTHPLLPHRPRSKKDKPSELYPPAPNPPPAPPHRGASPQTHSPLPCAKAPSPRSSHPIDQKVDSKNLPPPHPQFARSEISLVTHPQTPPSEPPDTPPTLPPAPFSQSPGPNTPHPQPKA